MKLIYENSRIEAFVTDKSTIVIKNKNNSNSVHIQPGHDASLMITCPEGNLIPWTWNDLPAIDAH